MSKNLILFDIPEVIETPRLYLQMPKAGYGKQVHEAITDGYEDYIRWLNWAATPPTQEDVEVDCRKHHADFILREWIRYIVIEKSTGDVLGRIGFPPFQSNWSIPQFGISYFIRKSKRHQGYATEACHGMCLLAFKVLGARKLEIYCDNENKASQGVPKRLNFSHEYTQKGGWPRQDGTLATLHTFSIFDVQDLPPLDIRL